MSTKNKQKKTSSPKKKTAAKKKPQINTKDKEVLLLIIQENISSSKEGFNQIFQLDIMKESAVLRIKKDDRTWTRVSEPLQIDEKTVEDLFEKVFDLQLNSRQGHVFTVKAEEFIAYCN